MPSLSTQGASLVAISVDLADESRKLAGDLGLTFPLLRDADLRVASDYGVAMQGRDLAIPAVFVVRSDRSIAWKVVGENMTDRPRASDVLEQALRAKIAPPR